LFAEIILMTSFGYVVFKIVIFGINS